MNLAPSRASGGMNLATLAAGMTLRLGRGAHAVVNAVLKSGEDKMSSRALIDGFSALIVLPAVFFLARCPAMPADLAGRFGGDPLRLPGVADQGVRGR